MITAEELAKEIDRLDEASNGPYAGPTELARGLLIFIQSRAAGAQVSGGAPALVKELSDAAHALGHWSTLRSTDQATIDYWADRVADLSRRLATQQPPNTIRVDVEQIGSCELDVRDGVAYMPAVTVQDIVSKSCLKAQPPKDAGAVPLPERYYMDAHGGMFVDNETEHAHWMRAADAREAAGRADAVPDGYVLMPRTPTNKITSAMACASEDPENERSSWDLAENMYRAAIEAMEPAARAQVAEYQVRPRAAKSDDSWRRVSKREFDDYAELPGFPDRDYERRKLFAHHSPAHAGAGDAEALAREVWTALDKESCPGVYMQIAYETVFRRLAGGDHAN